jgi:hypothetical protein
MTDDDIARLRELAESVIRAAEQRQEAADDPAIGWTEYERIAQDAFDQKDALADRVDARKLLALIDRLEAAERERDAMTALLREAAAALAGPLSLSCEHLSHKRRDRHSYDKPCPVEARISALRARIDTAFAAKEQSNG